MQTVGLSFYALCLRGAYAGVRIEIGCIFCFAFSNFMHLWDLLSRLGYGRRDGKLVAF